MAFKSNDEILGAVASIVPNKGEMLYTDLQQALLKAGEFEAAKLGLSLKQHGYKFRPDVSAAGVVSLFISKVGE